MKLEIQERNPAKILKSVRLSVEAAGLLDRLTAVYGTNDSLALEALINAYARGAIAGAGKAKGAKSK